MDAKSLALLQRQWDVVPKTHAAGLGLPPVGHVVYLHGFASSPGSSKARRFRTELARFHVPLSAPDFNEPDFRTLTVTRMLDQTRAAIEAAESRPVALIGSSLGAFVAVHAAARDRTGAVDRLLLLAPAFDFGGNRLRQLGAEGVEAWRRRGALTVFHYGLNETREVGFELYEDAASYDAFAVRDSKATLIVQGRRDTSVDPAMVAGWAAGRAHVDLRLVDDEHQLMDSMDGIWAEAERFFGLRRSD